MPQFQQDTITSVSSLLDALRHLTPDVGVTLWWFRGHSCSDYRLVPGVYRKYSRQTERLLLHRFIQGAPTRCAKCPSLEDYAGWLSLMQHYGLPTRLLDWTASPLFAAYFAVAHKPEPDKDGAIWMLVPSQLNQSSLGTEHIPWLHGNDAERFVNPPFVGGDNAGGAIAVVAPEIDVRMTVQQGTFTIHGDTTPLENNANANSFLIKFIIPKEAKPTVTKELQVLAIRKSTLFPDLANLADELSQDERYHLRGPPPLVFAARQP
jgi:hypothetical protein